MYILADIFSLFQRTGRRIDQRQLCNCLRVIGRGYGFWTSTVHGSQDLTGVNIIE